MKPWWVAKELRVVGVGCALCASCGGSVSPTGRSGVPDAAASSGGSASGGVATMLPQAAGGSPVGAGGKRSGAGGARSVGTGGAAGHGRDAGPDLRPDAGDASALTPLDPYAFCVARAKQWCARAAPCCCVPERVAQCEKEQTTGCSPYTPPDYDPLRAAQCLAALKAEMDGCYHVRADTAEAAAQRSACLGVIRGLPRLGEPCVSYPSWCEQLPDRSVWCNNQSEGAGSGHCEPGYPRASEGEKCDGGMTTCLDRLICEGGVCVPPHADGARCYTGLDCASGNCVDSSCSAERFPVATENDCSRFAGD